MTMVTLINGAGNSSSEHNYTWTDTRVTPGTTYTYTVVSVDLNGSREEQGHVNATPNLSSPQVNDYALFQNYLNPFNPTTQMAYDMKEAGFATIIVHNLLGQHVATLVNGNVTQGHHTAIFDASGLPSGVYVYKMETKKFNAQNKMLMIK